MPCIALCLLGLAIPRARANARPVPGLQGAIKVPFEMPLDGEATLALYNDRGGVVRILGQCVPLAAGRYEAAWDGMDLFGNLMPAGTALTLKVLSNRPLTATYEFTVGGAGDPPWLTRPQGEGAAMRTGGWMGDHTPPFSALAFEDRVFFGCKVAEHGHAVIATNLRGEKLWGRGGLEGWKGPHLLAHDGRHIWGVANETRVHRLDPATYRTQRLIDLGKDKAVALAARGGTLYIVQANHLAKRDLFTTAAGSKDIDPPKSRPQVDKSAPMPSGQLSAFARFGTVFTGSGGHPQTGLRAADGGGFAYFLVHFHRPVEVGTVVLGRINGASEAAVHVLRPGAKYDLSRLVPKPAGADAILQEAGGDWVPIGRTRMPNPLNFVTAPTAGIKTEALYVRLEPAGRTPPGKWTPTVGLCRILSRRLLRVDPVAGASVPKALVAPPEKKRSSKPGPAAANAFRVRAAKPLSEIHPAPVMIDLGEARTLDGICLLNCTGPVFVLDACVAPAGTTPDPADDAHWKEVMPCEVRRGKQGYASARTHHNERYYTFQDRLTTRALRLRFLAGRREGKWGVPPDVRRFECDDVALLALAEPDAPLPPHFLAVYDGQTGERKRKIAHPSARVQAMAFDAGGQLYCVRDNALCRSRIAGDEIQHTVLNDKDLRGPISLAVGAERIAVGDDERCAVLLFDKQGKCLRTVGGRGPRKRGPWDPCTVQSPTGVALDAEGKLWVAECQYSPKRIACFTPEGTLYTECFGPAEYGGGGFLDPDLKSFYYRSAHFALDFPAGTWRIRNLNDRLYCDETPSLDGSTFKYTKIGRAIYLDGRRYIVGDPGWQGSPGPVICLRDDDRAVWKPCAVIAPAERSRFLVAKTHWREHWLEQDLSGKGFIWCDHNGDGAYQVAEVELFDLDEDRFGKRGALNVPYWCSWIGPRLEFWGSNARLKPARFTDRGVPIYRAKDLEPFRYADLAPLVTNTMICGMRAKHGPGHTSLVTHDRSLLIEGQPWKVLPDMTLQGGPPPRPVRGQYVPPIAGHVLDNPLHWVGSAVTDSPLGEVAVMLGNSGRWFAWAADYGVIVGRIFTGERGGWGTDLPARRGTDVTHRRLGYECFFGHFVKAHNGRYYAVGGHGFHAVSRVDGLDGYRVLSVPVKVSPAAHASNAKLQPLLARTHAALAAQRKSKRRVELKARPIARRAPRFRLDGALTDWDAPRGFSAIDEKARLFVDAAYDAKGLYLAYAGVGHVANSAQDPLHLFKTGFCFDFRYRARHARSQQPAAGDRRIVFGNCGGKWQAVLYDYVDPTVPPDRHVEFASPWVTTRVARVTRLDEAGVDVRFHVVRDLDLRAGLPAGQTRWSAEAFLPWAALGMPPADPKSKDLSSLTCDFGILTGDSGGTGVEKRCYWSNRAAGLTVSDLGIEARIHPSTWGRMSFQPK